MPRIFDNIKDHLLPALQKTLEISERADFCVGYFNLRGWRRLGTYVDKWPGGADNKCRLLIGMQRLPEEDLWLAMSLAGGEQQLDNQTAVRLKRQLAEEFKLQLTIGAPTNADETSLKQLARQLRADRLEVKLYLKHSLHAKLYLLYRQDFNNPISGYLGSSNLTLAGLANQGELNVDVLDQDAAKKLADWFEDRWNEHWCIDITKELLEVLEASWARDELIPPHYIYINMAYHLAQEARTGLSEFKIPSEFGDRLFDYQVAAVKIAAHHLNKRDGVLIGDVVGLGKTLMATAVAKIFELDHFTETLIICPKNLVEMWREYVYEYRLIANVIPITNVTSSLQDMRRYRVVIIDESHNLRNPEGKRYRAIQEYIARNESKCILLSATPYNKTYVDLSSQLRLFRPGDADLGIRPEKYLAQIGETEFVRRHQAGPRTLAAFEFSEFSDDWRELMRLYLVRRTRSFIKQNYAELDEQSGRSYLTLESGQRSYFPDRVPKTVKFSIDETDPNDQYAKLFSQSAVDVVRNLRLPRYGLGQDQYLANRPANPATPSEQRQVDNLSRAGHRLQGFCRVNLFKRLESGGDAFLLSIERHILRNYIYLHAIENNLPLPIGTQDSGDLDPGSNDEDPDDVSATSGTFDDDEASETPESLTSRLGSEREFRRYAASVYQRYETSYKQRFSWIRPDLFTKALGEDLRKDAERLISVLDLADQWKPDRDAKLAALHKLVTERHPNEKVLVFSQFADTVRYLAAQLTARGVDHLAAVTGDTDDPSELARRFSPVGNNRSEIKGTDEEIRVLLSTDILSEGQNLQDCAIVVNYDLPWAIIRLIQRAGRVDRIGQDAPEILCYSFLPADGVERIIRLRGRVRDRLNENAEVVGTDEAFFEDERGGTRLLDLYHEKAGVLDGEDEDTEVDLASHAYQIWKNAIDRDPSLERKIPALPPVVFSARHHEASSSNPNGVLVYLKTADGNDALAWLDNDGKVVTESQFDILRAAACSPDTPAMERADNHHELLQKSIEVVAEQERSVGGQLGRPSGARFRTYERLKRYAEQVKGTLFDIPELGRAIEDIYRNPLRSTATDTLNRQMRSGITDERLADLVIGLRSEDRLTVNHEQAESREPQIVCSLGLVGEATAE